MRIAVRILLCQAESYADTTYIVLKSPWYIDDIWVKPIKVIIDYLELAT
jgi:hypothetical protein